MATAKATRIAVSRRALIKGGLAVGAGLVVGFQLPSPVAMPPWPSRPISRPTSGSPSTATGA